jgi:hypothetical protein
MERVAMEGALERLVEILGVAVLVLIVVLASRKGFMRSYREAKAAGGAGKSGGAQGAARRRIRAAREGGW